MRWLVALALLLAPLGARANLISQDPAFTPSEPPPPADFTASCTLRCAEKEPGVCAAPAYVHVDCIGDGTAGPAGETSHNDASVRPFHDLGYAIDYGDSACSSGQGSWANSAVGHPKNKEYQPLGAHVYECAGNFTITTTVTDSLGNEDVWTSPPLTIVSSDAAWVPATSTWCVANVTPTPGSDGCPAGATARTGSADFDANLQGAAGKRTLFRCGNAFTMGSDVALTNAETNGSLVAGYGADCGPANPVHVTTVGSSSYLSPIGTAFSGWRFVDLEFTAGARVLGTKILMPGQSGCGGGCAIINKALLLRTSSLDVGACQYFYREHGGSGFDVGDWNTLTAMFSNRCRLSNIVYGGSSTWLGFYGLRFRYGAIVDNLQEWAATNSGDIAQNRTMGMQHTIVAHSKQFCDAVASPCTWQWRSMDGVADMPSQWNVHTDFTVYSNSGFGGLWMLLDSVHGAIQGGDLEEFDNRDLIVDAYRWATGPNQTSCGGGNHFQIMWANVTFRNMVFADFFQTCSFGVNYLNLFVPAARDARPHNVHVYNTTIVRGTAAVDGVGATVMGTGALCCGLGDSVGNGARARSNQIYDIVAGGGTATYAGFGCLDCLNSDTVHRATTQCPFQGANPVTQDCSFTDRSGLGGFNCSETAFKSFDFVNCLKLRTAGGGVETVANDGYPFPETTTTRRPYVYMDSINRCRGGQTGGPDTLFDIGAYERDAIECR